MPETLLGSMAILVLKYLMNKEGQNQFKVFCHHSKAHLLPPCVPLMSINKPNLQCVGTLCIVLLKQSPAGLAGEPVLKEFFSLTPFYAVR